MAVGQIPTPALAEASQSADQAISEQGGGSEVATGSDTGEAVPAEDESAAEDAAATNAEQQQGYRVATYAAPLQVGVSARRAPSGAMSQDPRSIERSVRARILFIFTSRARTIGKILAYGAGTIAPANLNPASMRSKSTRGSVARALSLVRDWVDDDPDPHPLLDGYRCHRGRG